MKDRVSIKSARLATLAVFFVNGLLLANWVARIPVIQNRLGMSEGVLGLALMGLSAGVIVALSMAGGMVGSRDMLGRISIQGWTAAVGEIEEGDPPGRSYHELS